MSLMNLTQETIRRIAEFKFPSDKKRAEEYVKNFNPSDPLCIDDEREYSSRMTESLVAEERQRFRTEDYFIRKLIYDFYTGEVHAYLFPNARDDAKKKAEELLKGNPEEQKMAEWVRGGFTDKPIIFQSKKPLLYEEAIIKFSDKYGINLDAENIASAVQDTARNKENRKDEYRQYFKCLFASAYTRLTEDQQSHIDVFFKDFNKVMMTVLQEKTGIDDIPAMKGKEFAYGGLSEEEIKDYLFSFRESANDLTKQAQIANKKEKDPFGKAEENVNEILKDKSDAEEDALSLGMAQLQALQIEHGTHPKYFWLTSPIKYFREKQAINRIKQKLISFSSDKQKVEELERNKTIYRPSFAKEQERITIFAQTAVKEFDLDTVLTSENLDLELDSLEPIAEIRESIYDKEPAFSDNRVFEDVVKTDFEKNEHQPPQYELPEKSEEPEASHGPIVLIKGKNES